MIKVSVIIPIYNGEEYLERCLDSVLSQTLKEIEVICVDDGSTDRTGDILSEYEQKDSRVQVLYQKNQYAGVARNNGLRHAKGEYLAFLDADDYFEPDFLEKMYFAGKANQSDVVMCNEYFLDVGTGEITKREPAEEKELLPVNAHCFSASQAKDVLFQLTNGWAWDKLFLREYVLRENIEFAATRIANDAFFVYVALAKAGRITKIEDFLIFQRRNDKRSLSNTREKFWHCGLEMLQDLQDELIASGLYEKMERTYLNFVLKYMVWSIRDMESWKVKEEMWEHLKQQYEPQVRLLDKPEEYYYNKGNLKNYMYMIQHSFEESMKEQISQKDETISSLRSRNAMLSERIKEKVWRFPYEKVTPGERIVLYGAGQMGQDYKAQIDLTGYCKLVLWLDQKFEQMEEPDSIKGWLDCLANVDYDKLVIALKRENDIEEVKAMLRQRGIPNEKIISTIVNKSLMN